MEEEETQEEAGGPTVKAFDMSGADGQWFYVSDSHVTRTSPDEVMRSQAYLLFYELLPFQV